MGIETITIWPARASQHVEVEVSEGGYAVAGRARGLVAIFLGFPFWYGFLLTRCGLAVGQL